MKEIKGNLWDYFGKKGYVVCVTTNGFVKKNGEVVMGKGCALEAARLFPSLPKLLGKRVREEGNVVHEFRFPSAVGKRDGRLLTFPVKHSWWEEANLDLIADSLHHLKAFAEILSEEDIFILPRPGCGNGRLQWKEVKGMLEEIVVPDNVWVIHR